jgi:hypothetical protein
VLEALSKLSICGLMYFIGDSPHLLDSPRRKIKLRFVLHGACCP